MMAAVVLHEEELLVARLLGVATVTPCLVSFKKRLLANRCDAMNEDDAVMGSVTLLLSQLQAGERDVCQDIFDIYFQRLALLGDRVLSARHRRARNGEDLAVEVLASLFEQAAGEAFPILQSRHDLWRLLSRRLKQRAATQVRDSGRLKRGGGNVSGESIFRKKDGSWDPTGISNVADRAASAILEMNHDLINSLDDELLREITQLLLEGYSINDIASSLQRSRATIYRKLALIRDHWQQQSAGGQVDA